MALLNYAKTLEEVKRFLLLPESSTGDYVKLVFTQDGHIITHGSDLLADYLAGKRGLIPNYNTSLGDYAVFGKTGWEKLTTNHLPIATLITPEDNNSILTSKLIVDYVAKEIGAGFAANDAMVFKGGITKLSDITLPYSAGYTYRATESFTFTTDKKTWVVAPGDIVIATSDSDTLDNNHFIVVEANINGTSEISINGKTYKIYTESVEPLGYSFYAPTGPGNIGEILQSTNGVPEWVPQSNLNAGQLQGKTLEELIDNVTANNGEITVTVGGVQKNAVASGSWNITAAKVAKALGLGEGLLFADNKTSYDGSEVRTINLAPATSTSLGGVKVGDHISVNAGTISLTKENIVGALGYTPFDPKDVYAYPVVNKAEDGLAPKLITSNVAPITSAHYLLAFDDIDSAPSWYKLPGEAFSNTWRPVSVNGESLFDSVINNLPLNLVNGDNVTITKSGNDIIIAAVDTTYDLVTETKEGLMSAEAYKKLLGIEAGALKNVNAFSQINVGLTEVKAEKVLDAITFSGENIKIEAIDKNIKFSLGLLSSTSTANTGYLVSAPKTSEQGLFLKGDGTWATPLNTNTWRKIIVGASELNNDITSGDLTIVGSDATSVALNGNILTISSTNTVYTAGEGLNLTNEEFSLKIASASTLGGIKTGYTTSEDARKYAVELDNDNKAFVNVPWIADTNTWRDIQINGVSIGEKVLNIVPSEEIHIVKDDSDTEGVYEIGFGLSWYNISANNGTGAYEYAN